MPRTGEHVVIKPNGDAARCRTVFRVPLEDRWDAEEILNIRATPRSPTPSSGEGEIRAPLAEDASDDADRRKGRREVLEEQVAQDRDPGASTAMPEERRQEAPDSRRFRITDRVLLKYGFSSDCQGCEKHFL